MSRHAINYRAFVQIVVYLVVIVSILMVTDYSFRLCLENVRTIKLKDYSQAGLGRISSDIALLEAEVKAIDQRVVALRSQTYPSLDDIKMLSHDFNLRLDKMERLTTSVDRVAGLHRYNTTFRGTVGSLVRFIRKLETNFIFSTEYVILYPIDEEGKVIGLAMAVLIEESR